MSKSHYQQLYDGGLVQRYHTRPTIRPQNVAAHSWGVAVMLTEICEPPSELLRAALFHDCAEYWTGDTPFNAKQADAELAAGLLSYENKINRRLGIDTLGLSIEEKWWLKMADMLELCWYAVYEYRMGNQLAEEWYTNGTNYINKSIDESDFNTARVRQALVDVHKAWLEAR